GGTLALPEPSSLRLAGSGLSPSHSGSFCLPYPSEGSRSSVIASHLIQPLLGTSSALLSLLRQDTPDEKELIGKLEPAIDSSGRAERLSPGRNCSTFFRVGGAGLLKRWEQSMLNAKTKRNDPLQLSLPASRPASNRISRQPTPSASRVTTPSQGLSPRKVSVSPLERNGLASKMLDHRSKSTGEKVGWDDSHPEDTPMLDKGKGREMEDLKNGTRQKEPDEEEEEPATDDDSEVLAAPPLSTNYMHEYQLPLPSSTLQGSSFSTIDRQPSPSFPLPTPTLPQPSPSPADTPLISQTSAEEKKVKKKRKAEEEEAEALERRKAKFAMLKSGSSTSRRRGGATQVL
ncbi:uncharacterized protein JCM6883_000291, partial [Sporobolomyces salmoneus]|uniref:uncharacterized protein n=1 Tax=Sporobolomyces salmoneus TaxID=183962 RepID=UPI0031737DA9